MSTTPTVRLAIDLGTNKLKEALGRMRTMVSTGTQEIKRKLSDLTPEINTGKLQTGLNKSKKLVDTSVHEMNDKLDDIKARGVKSEGFFASLNKMKVVGLGIIALIFAGLGKSIESGMEGIQQKTSFEVLAGTKAGDQLYGDLTKFAQDSIFGDELYKDAQTMLAFGANVREVMPDLRMLGDISMGDKQKLESLTIAFSQIRSTGRLMGQDLMQLTNAGFNPLQVISEKTGQSMASLKEKMEKGGISFAMVKNAFISATSEGGKFYQMTDKMAKTVPGQWENLKGQLSGIVRNIGTALLPAVGSLIAVAAPLLDQFGAAIQAIVPIITNVVAQGVSLLPNFKEAFGSILTAIAPLKDVLFSLPIKQLIVDVLGLVTTVGQILAPVIKELSPVVSVLGSVLGDVLHHAVQVVSNLLKDFGPTLTNIAHILSRTLTPAIKGAGVLLNFLIDVAGGVLKVIMAILEPITKLLSWVADGYGDMMDKIADVVGTKTNAITERLKQGVNNDEIVNFFRTAGEMQGKAYVNSLLEQYAGVAKWMDDFFFGNKRHDFSDAVNRVKDSLSGKTSGSGLNPEQVTVDDKGQKSASTISPSQSASSVSKAAQQTKNITINFGSYIKGDVITQNHEIANMSKEELDKWLRQHFLALVHSIDDGY